MNPKLLKAGIILGVVFLTLGVFSLFYVTEIAHNLLAITIGGAIIGFVIPFVIILFFINDLRNALGGYWSFKQAVKSIFILLIIAESISYVGKNMIYSTYIDPLIEYKIRDAMIDATSNFMTENKVDRETMNIKLNEMREKLDPANNKDLKKRLLDLGKNALYITIGALIFGAIYQKKEFVSDFEELA